MVSIYDDDYVDPTKCPVCLGPADNGWDRQIPPNPYFCTKCTEEFEELMQQELSLYEDDM